MAFNPAPNAWIPSWSEDGTSISVPIASFPQMNAAEADGAAGDIRKVLFAVAEALWQKWNSLPAADKPTQMQIRRNTIGNDAAGTVTRTYTFTFTTATTAEEVSPEPV